jgi:hypothetical protein
VLVLLTSCACTASEHVAPVRLSNWFFL